MAEKKLTRPQMPAQRGPNCGLYALTAAARALDPTQYAELYATKGDHTGVRSGSAPQSLRYTAKRLAHGTGNATQIGEIFSASAMVALAQAIGLQARAVSNPAAWTPLIKTAIDAGRYMLAPFGVSDSGEPQSTGNRPHWCIVYGYKETWFGQNIAYVVHWGRSFEFGTSDLRKSSKALKTFRETWEKTHKPLKFVKAGTKQVAVHAGGIGGVAYQAIAVPPQFNFDADLPTMLAGQLVEVWK